MWRTMGSIWHRCLVLYLGTGFHRHLLKYAWSHVLRIFHRDGAIYCIVYVLQNSLSRHRDLPYPSISLAFLVRFVLSTDKDDGAYNAIKVPICSISCWKNLLLSHWCPSEAGMWRWMLSYKNINIYFTLTCFSDRWLMTIASITVCLDYLALRY